MSSLIHGLIIKIRQADFKALLLKFQLLICLATALAIDLQGFFSMLEKIDCLKYLK